MPVIEVIMRQGLPGTALQNTYHFAGPTLNISDGQTLAETIADIYEERFAASMHETWVLLDALCRVADVQGSPYVVAEFPNVAGTNDTQRLPNRLALLVNFAVPVPAPNRKRVFLSGWGEGLNVDGAPLAGLVELGTQFAQDIQSITSVNGKACQHVVARRTGNPAYVTAYNALTTVHTSTQWASLSSRVPA